MNKHNTLKVSTEYVTLNTSAAGKLLSGRVLFPESIIVFYL
jgi:hypothetical protein